MKCTGTKLKTYALRKMHWLKETGRQAVDRKEIFAKHMSVKGLVSRIYIGFLQSHSKQINTMKSMTKDLNKFFTKGDIQMTNRHMKVYSTSIVISGKQVKTTMSGFTTCSLKWLKTRGLAIPGANEKCRATRTLIPWTCKTLR